MPREASLKYHMRKTLLALLTLFAVNGLYSLETETRVFAGGGNSLMNYQVDRKSDYPHRAGSTGIHASGDFLLHMYQLGYMLAASGSTIKNAEFPWEADAAYLRTEGSGQYYNIDNRLGWVRQFNSTHSGQYFLFFGIRKFESRYHVVKAKDFPEESDIDFYGSALQIGFTRRDRAYNGQNMKLDIRSGFWFSKGGEENFAVDGILEPMVEKDGGSIRGIGMEAGVSLMGKSDRYALELLIHSEDMFLQSGQFHLLGGMDSILLGVTVRL